MFRPDNSYHLLPVRHHFTLLARQREHVLTDKLLTGHCLQASQEDTVFSSGTYSKVNDTIAERNLYRRPRAFTSNARLVTQDPLSNELSRYNK